MSPERLFGKDRVANSAAISRFLWLSPSDGETPTYGPATTSNLATLALNAYADEVWEFLQLLNLAGLSSDSEIARLNDLFARTFSILSQGIGCAAHGVLRVPHRSAESLALLIDHLDRS